MKKILICGYFGFGNAGDELILENIAAGIKNKIPDADFTVMYKNPPEIEYLPQIRLSDRWNPISVVKELLNTDLLICAGGLFQDLTGSFSLWYYLAVIMLAKMFGKKVLLFGVDFTPINRKLNKVLLKKTLHFVDKICARSEGSVEFLKEIGVESNVILTADSVFLHQNLVSKVFNPENDRLQKVGIVLKNKGNDENAYIQTISEMSKSLKNNLNVEIVFIPFHLERDLDISLKVSKALDFAVTITRWRKPQDLFEIIKNTDFFRAAYNVLLNKDRGPKLAPFILALGEEKVIRLFEKA